jgi:hypothetical protein
MISKVKDIFRTASKATGDFFGSFGKGDRDLDAMDPNPGGTYEDGKFKKSPRYVLDKLGRTNNYEDYLRAWNSRMRKFAVQRYYASLGKK